MHCTIIGETETSRKELVVSRVATYVVGALVAMMFGLAGAAQRPCSAGVAADQGLGTNAMSP